MPLGTEINVGPSHIVLDGVADTAKGAQPPPSFRFMSIVAKQLDGWIKMALGVKVCLGPGDIVLDGDPAPLS